MKTHVLSVSNASVLSKSFMVTNLIKEKDDYHILVEEIEKDEDILQLFQHVFTGSVTLVCSIKVLK